MLIYEYFRAFEWSLEHGWYFKGYSTDEYSKWLPIALYLQRWQELNHRIEQQGIKEFLQNNF